MRIKRDTQRNRQRLGKCFFCHSHGALSDLLGKVLIFLNSHGVQTDLFEEVLIVRD